MLKLSNNSAPEKKGCFEPVMQHRVTQTEILQKKWKIKKCNEITEKERSCISLASIYYTDIIILSANCHMTMRRGRFIPEEASMES